MTDPTPTNRLQEIQEALASLNNSINALGPKVKGLETEVASLKELDAKVDRLREIDDARISIEIEELTTKLEALRSNAPRKRFDVKSFFLDLPKNLLTYWTLLAFLLTAIVAIYVYKKYGVGYFETYENIANTKQSANYYLRTGDVLRSRAEFPAAEQAYKTATEIDPYNLEARRGLMLAQLLKPQEGEQTDSSEVFHARLAYLEAEPAFKDNPLLLYFHGRIADLEGDRVTARKYFQDSIKQMSASNQSGSHQPGVFVGNYIELGILDMWEGDIDNAINNFKTPDLDKIKQTTALNHLAECYIVSNRFDEAERVLSSLYHSSPRVETYLIFGDFLRYRFAMDPVKRAQDLESARTMDRLAQDTLGDVTETTSEGPSPQSLKAGIDYGRMHFIPFPLSNTPQFKDHSITDPSKPQQYRALTNYALSLDYALANDFAQANQYYLRALATDTFNEYRCAFVYKTRFYRSKLPSAPPSLVAWFDTKAETLAINRCLPLSPPKVKSQSGGIGNQ